jgi:hypothetical protein
VSLIGFQAGMMALVSGGGATDPYFSSVVSLLHGDGTNGSTTFTDQIAAKTWTRNGTTTVISTTQSKWGGASVYIGNTVGTATTNGITTPSHADFNFGTADFTLEWWQYLTTLADYQNAFDRGGVTAGGLLLETGSADGKYICCVGGTTVMTEASAATINVWEHHALVKDAGTLRKYRGGVQTSSVANATSITNTAAAAWGAYANGSNATAAYMDDCRITKGVCRYPSGTTFTPPTAAFPNS